MTKDRIDDWLRFFDHDGFAGNPDWASCYCLEPHEPATPEQPERAWRERRATMAERIPGGTTFGYLAYVDGRPAGWVNASLRSDYGLYRHVDPDGPEPTSVIGVSCFVIAPPFRRHGIASALLDRVIADASARGAAWIEGYPLKKPEESDAGHFRGPRSSTTHADSSRSRCGNVTQWCADRLFLLGYHHTTANATDRAERPHSGCPPVRRRDNHFHLHDHGNAETSGSRAASARPHILLHLVENEFDIGEFVTGLVPSTLAARGEAHGSERAITAERRGPSCLLHGLAVRRGLIAIVGREVRQLACLVEREPARIL